MSGDRVTMTWDSKNGTVKFSGPHTVAWGVIAATVILRGLEIFKKVKRGSLVLEPQPHVSADNAVKWLALSLPDVAFMKLLSPDEESSDEGVTEGLELNDSGSLLVPRLGSLIQAIQSSFCRDARLFEEVASFEARCPSDFLRGLCGTVLLTSLVLRTQRRSTGVAWTVPSATSDRLVTERVVDPMQLLSQQMEAFLVGSWMYECAYPECVQEVLPLLLLYSG